MFSLLALLALALIVMLGALLTQLPGLWNQLAARQRRGASPLGPVRWRKTASRWVKALIVDQIGGYVHDTAMSQFIPPNTCHYVTGTWTQAAGSVGNTICMSRAQADASTVITIPIVVPQNSVAQKGSYLKSIDIWWEVLTAAADAVTAVIYKATLPATGSDFAAPSAQTFTYDAGHDTAAERLTLDEHKMTLTITTPFWMDDDDLVTVQLTVDAAATTDLTFFGARANFTLRM